MRLTDHAHRQHGVFSRRQALASGLSDETLRRRRREGTWREPVVNVYAHAGFPMTTAAWRWAAILSCGDRAVLSHRSAAEIWDMPVLVPPRPELSVPHGVRACPGPRVKLRRIAVPAHDVRFVGGLPVTSRERTVLDCLLSLPPNQSRELLDRALQRGWVDLPGIVAAVHDARGRWGVRRARTVLASADPVTASDAERVAQALLAAGGVTG